MAGFYTTAGKFDLLARRGSGWRAPQLGAISGCLAHWTLGDPEPPLVSLPTGLGKTGVALAAPFLQAPVSRLLVVVPSQVLRSQIAEAFRTLDLLRRIGALPDRGPSPKVMELTGLAADWNELESFDVVVALPNSVSPAHYEDQKPKRDLFDLVVIDEAHHAPATTWRAILDHFESQQLLMTATPIRRDGRRLPGRLVYHYPVRRALEEQLFHPITPAILPASATREAADRAIAERALQFLGNTEHASSVLLVRAGNIARLQDLREVYEGLGTDLVLLHSRLAEARKKEILDGLTGGQIRAVGVVGMLGEGFDLPSVRLLAYHDKHRSLPATVQLLGRLARVSEEFPQPSVLITVRDIDVFPELQGAVRALYEEDRDWAQILPGIIDEEIERERRDQEFVDSFSPSETDISAVHLEPLKRALVFEVPPDWRPEFGDAMPEDLQLGQKFSGGTIVYSAAANDLRLLVLVIRFVEQPKWSSDPAMADVSYELQILALRRPERTGLPAFLFVNADRVGAQNALLEAIGVSQIAKLIDPARVGQYADSLDRLSVSSVGIRPTNAANRGTTAYRTHMGSGVDRGLRSVDTSRAALGHVMLQIRAEGGSATGGVAWEKGKFWLAKYGPLRELDEWLDDVAARLWFPSVSPAGPLVPGVERGVRLERWPDAPPLAAEINPALFGRGYELWNGLDRLGPIEDLDIYVAQDPFGVLADATSPGTGALPLIGVFNDRTTGGHVLAWQGEIDTSGRFHSSLELEVRRGYGGRLSLSDVLQEEPPTIYFLDGTTTVGSIRYDSRHRTFIDLNSLRGVEWPEDIDLTAETHATALDRGMGIRSIHEFLEEHLQAEPRRGVMRWILYNDGPGEIADYIALEELATGEIDLGLWHAKASGHVTPGLRVKDMQEVVAQAIRSRRRFTSTRLWSELGDRLTGLSSPAARLVDGSDDEMELHNRLGLVPETEETSWARRLPNVVGRLGVVQPGVSISRLRDGLESSPPEDAALSLRELLTVLSDTAFSDGQQLSTLLSP